MRMRYGVSLPFPFFFQTQNLHKSKYNYQSCHSNFQIKKVSTRFETPWALWSSVAYTRRDSITNSRKYCPSVYSGMSTPHTNTSNREAITHLPLIMNSSDTKRKCTSYIAQLRLNVSLFSSQIAYCLEVRRRYFFSYPIANAFRLHCQFSDTVFCRSRHAQQTLLFIFSSPICFDYLYFCVLA